MMLKKVVLWVIAIFIAILIAIFQRATGPTYPVKGKLRFENIEFKYRFPRSCTILKNTCIGKIYDTKIDGYILYKRYNLNDEFQKIPFEFDGKNTYFKLNDNFPKAAKIEYDVYFLNNDKEHKINDKRIVLRYKGDVPGLFLITHIIFMFLFMISSTYIFLENNLLKDTSKKIFYSSYIFLIVGGFVLGPVVQYYAFDILWSGFPLGYDLTDNKTLLILVFWSVVIYKFIKNSNYKKWINIAYLFTVIIYLIPHSVFGSEYDYSSKKLKNVY